MTYMLTTSPVASKRWHGSGRIAKQPQLLAPCISAALAMVAIVTAPAMAHTPVDQEMFKMPDGQLNGQTPGFAYTSLAFPTWGLDDNLYEPDPNLAGSEISVLNGSVKVSSNTTGVTTTSKWIRKAIWMPDPATTVFQFWAKKGSYTGTNVTSWYLSCGMASTDTIADRSFGRWTGTSDEITCYDGTFDNALVTVPLTDEWQCFTAVGDSTTRAVTFYYVGNSLIAQGHCWAHCNPKVYWVTMKSFHSSSGSSYAWLDNFSYGGTVLVLKNPENPYSGEPEQPVVWSESPDDAGAPNPVTGFTAVGFNGQVALSWSNPASWDFRGTMIRFATTGYPTSVTDGTLLIDQPGLPGTPGGYIHSGLTNDVTCYYSAFTHDLVPNYSAKADASGTPWGGECWNEPFTYLDGLLAGNGIWTGACAAVTVDNETVKIVGEGESCRCTANVTCEGAKGIILVSAQVKAGAGSDNMWDFWINDAAGNNLARWYGSGTSARPRIGGTDIVLDPVALTGGWDTLEVQIDTNRDYSYFYFNATLLGGVSHGSTGAGNTVGSVWLGRQPGTTLPGQYVWFDNIVIPVPRGLADFDRDGDVDQEDFGHFQACLSGSGQSYLPGCTNADLDGDSDVDDEDFSTFYSCISGSNQASGC